jgi:hypothetical protein
MRLASTVFTLKRVRRERLLEKTMVTPEKAPDAELVRVETLARWLDDRGLDPLLGLLLPGIGDLVGGLLGLYVIGVAVRRRLPGVVVARMLVNIGVDSLVGAVPVAGDLFDFAWKSNRRNVNLLKAHRSRRSTWRDWLAVAGAAALALVAVTLPIVAIGWLVAHLR